MSRCLWLAMAVMLLAMSGCSTTNRYVKTHEGPCVIHHTDRVFGLAYNNDDTLVRKCPKALQEDAK